MNENNKKYPLGQPIDYADPKNLADESTVDLASTNGLGNVEGAIEPSSPEGLEALITPVKPDKTRRVVPIPGVSATSEKE